jgi:hypothetical protein
MRILSYRRERRGWQVTAERNPALNTVQGSQQFDQLDNVKRRYPKLNATLSKAARGVSACSSLGL